MSIRTQTLSDNYLDERDIHISIGSNKGKEEIAHGDSNGKRSAWDNEGLGAPTRHTTWSRQMGNSRSISECYVRNVLGWRNAMAKGQPNANNMSAECLKNCQLFPYTGVEDNSNTRWNIRKLGDFGPVQFKD